MRKHGFTAVEAAIVLVIIAIVVGVTMWQVDKRRQAQLRAESAANLTTVYATFMSRRANAGGPGQEWAVMWPRYPGPRVNFLPSAPTI